MGLIFLDIEIGNPANPEIRETIECLIDSGAVYSVIPEEILTRLGIKPFKKETFRLADGTKVIRQKGSALFKYGERMGVADVVFGEPDDHVLLGVLTLESLGLSFNPLKRELNPLPMVL